MNYLYEKFIKPNIPEYETFCDFSLLSVQLYTLKLMYNGKSVQENYEQRVDHGQRFNFYKKVKLPGATLYNVKTYENIGYHNQIRIENIVLDHGGRIIINIFRGEDTPDDTDNSIFSPLKVLT